VFGRSGPSVFTQTHVRKQALKAWAAENARREENQQPLLSPITLHELRHSYVSMMHAAGFSLTEIADYVGHSSAYMTDHYRHLMEGHEADAAEKFEQYLAKTAGASTGAQSGKPVLHSRSWSASQAVGRGFESLHPLLCSSRFCSVVPG